MYPEPLHLHTKWERLQNVRMVAQINSVFTQLFFIMGVYPMVYALLLIPAGRSGNKVCLPSGPGAETCTEQDQA